jgi:predicted 3-demethylubiquinone-9 3-methyltransferase (glyoxalase superfamily)
MTKKLTPFLMFTGKADEAMAFYVSLFDDGEVLHVRHIGPGEPGTEGQVRLAEFQVAGQRIRCIDSPPVHEFTFTPSMSLFVTCDDAAEQEKLYAALLEGGKALMPLDDYDFGRLGWVEDRFGISWQLALD